MAKQKNNCGQSMFEIVVALAISAIVIVGIVSLVAASLRNSTYSKNSGRAAAYAQAATEWLRGERDRDVNLFMEKVQTPVFCLPDLSWDTAKIGSCGLGDEISPDKIFSRQVSFSTSLENAKILIEADISVSWEDSQGIHEVKSVTNFTDWRQR